MMGPYPSPFIYSIKNGVPKAGNAVLENLVLVGRTADKQTAPIVLKKLPLRELERPAGLGLAVLLPFDDAGVAGEESALL